MERTDPEMCVLCGEPAAGAPRIFVRQVRGLDASIAHRLALCRAHGAELVAGERTPQQIIYAWATRAHDDLYRNERLVLQPELRCLACNGALPRDSAIEVRCPACGAANGLGSALGHPVAVRVRAAAPGD
jgi:hypothetical protein